MKKVMMFFAEGFEEVEALSVVDVLRRGGVDVEMSSIDNNEIVTGSHGIGVVMNRRMEEVSIDDIESFDGFLLPGGMPGTLNLKKSDKVRETICHANEKGKLLGAICAAPIVFGACDILKGKKATCYPGFEKDLTGAETTTDSVVVDGNIVTSRGVGTALDFGLTLLGILTDEENSKKIKESILH